MGELKLIALDAEDLQVISAQLQDAVVRVGDLSYSRNDKRFVTVLNRFDWDSAGAGKRADEYERRQSGLRIEKVVSAKLQGVQLSDKERVLSLLALSYEETTAPGGIVTIVFSGDTAIQLEVECVEAELKDLGAAWGTTNLPSHPDEDGAS